MLKVCEIFASIQGESTLQGLPTVFVRLSGCNLNCSYCDSRFANSEGESLSFEEILRRIDKYPAGNRVCVTGGEPLCQLETVELVNILLERGKTVSVETNGSLDVSILPEKAIRIVDVKCPDSNEGDSFLPKNYDYTIGNFEYKFVVASRADFDFAIGIVEKHNLLAARAVLISPVEGRLSPDELAEWIVNEAPDIHLQLQLHRFIWPSETKGR